MPSPNAINYLKIIKKLFDHSAYLLNSAVPLSKEVHHALEESLNDIKHNLLLYSLRS